MTDTSIKQRLKLRPYRKILLLPHAVKDHEIEGWEKQNRELHKFMNDQFNSMNLDQRPVMIPVWILRCQNFIKENKMTLYLHRLRRNEEIKDLLKTFQK